jgi:hypothetical protein
MYTELSRTWRAFVLSIAGAGALAAASCTGGGTQQQAPGATQPRVATYRCGVDGDIRIVNTGASVLVSEYLVVLEEDSEESGTPGESRFELVAAPPNQRSRYGAEGLALVIEGREALWMKAGSAPLTCTR